MSLAPGPDLIAIPGPSPVPARVLRAAADARAGDSLLVTLAAGSLDASVTSVHTDEG